MFRLFLSILFNERGGTLAITRKTSNTLITAAGFNTNYDEIEAVINGAIDADNIEDDAVSAAKLNSDVVRGDYGLVQHTDGTLYVDVSDTNPGLELTDGGLRVKVDDSSIERASGGIQVKALGITNAMLAGSIADGKLTETYYTAARFVTAHDADDHSGMLPLDVDDMSGILGDWASKSLATSYLAATDGFVVAMGDGSCGVLKGYTDSSNPPTTLRQNAYSTEANHVVNLMFPVKKGDYYRVTVDATSGTVYWIPLGA